MGNDESLAAIDGPSAGQGKSETYTFPLVALTLLFFVWGFITSLNDILIPHLKSVFSLNYTQAMLIQFCFFGAYFLVSMPASALIMHIPAHSEHPFRFNMNTCSGRT